MLKKGFILLAIGVVLLTSFFACTAEEREVGERAPKESVTMSSITITITYDNNPYDSRLMTAWGFSCVVGLPKQTILFDTGGDGSILLSNMKELGIEPKEIDAVVLSHIHGDHTGGLASFLNENSDVTVYLPRSFPQSFKSGVESFGAKVEEIQEAKELFGGVFTTGELNGGIKEQALVIETSSGLVVITGCAHPGVVAIVRKAKQITGDEVYLVLGGFHFPEPSVVQSFKELGVQKAAPCHCSGDEARELFKESYGEDYIETGVGKEIMIP